MRPSSPKSSVFCHMEPSSPPQTPTGASPVFSRRAKASPRPPSTSPGPRRKGLHSHSGPMSQSSNNKPLDSGQFSYTRSMRPQDLSPASSSPSSAKVEAASESDPESSEAGDGPMSPKPVPRIESASQLNLQTQRSQVTTDTSLVIEEVSDLDDSDIGEHVIVVQPDAIEDAESERSRSRSRPTTGEPHLDRHMMSTLKDLNFGGPESDDDFDPEDLDEDACEAWRIKMRAVRRAKRMSQGSIGKRTFSERDSDSDKEDARHSADFNEVGSSSRKLKRRAGDRRSLILSDLPSKIDEMDEPEELTEGETLAKELPFYSYSSMEIDSP